MIRSPVIRRSLALAILVLALVAIHAVVIGPIFEAYRGNRQAISAQEAALERYQRIARQLPVFEAKLAALEQRGQATSQYLAGRDATLAAAALQERVKALIHLEGGQPRSVRILTDRERRSAGPTRVAVREEAVMNLPTLQRVLYLLESGTPDLFIDNLGIRAIQPSLSASGDRGDAMLEVRFDVYGYLQGVV